MFSESVSSSFAPFIETFQSFVSIDAIQILYQQPWLRLAYVTLTLLCVLYMGAKYGQPWQTYKRRVGRTFVGAAIVFVVPLVLYGVVMFVVMFGSLVLYITPPIPIAFEDFWVLETYLFWILVFGVMVPILVLGALGGCIESRLQCHAKQ